MNTWSRYAVLLLVLMHLVMKGNGQSWKQVSPDVLYDNITGACKTSDGALYLCTYGGSIISTKDGGAVWSTRLSIDTCRFSGILEHQGSVYAYGSSGTVLVSSDGIVWEERSIDSNATITALALDDNGVGLASIGYYSAYLYKTTNSGRTWFKIPANQNENVGSIVCMGKGKFIVGGEKYQITTDAGLTWRSPGAYTSNLVYTMAYHGDTVIVIRRGSYNSLVVDVSVDGGQTRSTLQTFQGVYGFNGSIHPDSQGMFYIVVQQKLYRCDARSMSMAEIKVDSLLKYTFENVHCVPINSNRILIANAGKSYLATITYSGDLLRQAVDPSYSETLQRISASTGVDSVNYLTLMRDSSLWLWNATYSELSHVTDDCPGRHLLYDSNKVVWTYNDSTIWSSTNLGKTWEHRHSGRVAGLGTWRQDLFLIETTGAVWRLGADKSSELIVTLPLSESVTKQSVPQMIRFDKNGRAAHVSFIDERPGAKSKITVIYTKNGGAAWQSVTFDMQDRRSLYDGLVSGVWINESELMLIASLWSGMVTTPWPVISSIDMTSGQWQQPHSEVIEKVIASGSERSVRGIQYDAASHAVQLLLSIAGNPQSVLVSLDLNRRGIATGAVVDAWLYAMSSGSLAPPIAWGDRSVWRYGSATISTATSKMVEMQSCLGETLFVSIDSSKSAARRLSPWTYNGKELPNSAILVVAESKHSFSFMANKPGVLGKRVYSTGGLEVVYEWDIDIPTYEPSEMFGPSDVCIIDTALYQATRGDGTRIVWSTTDNGAIIGSDTSDVVLVSWSRIGSGKVYLSSRALDSKCAAMDSIDVVVYSRPSAKINGSRNVSMNEVATYASDDDSSSSYFWSVLHGKGQIVKGERERQSTVAWNEAGVDTLVLRVTSISTGCSSEALASIRIGTVSVSDGTDRVESEPIVGTVTRSGSMYTVSLRHDSREREVKLYSVSGEVVNAPTTRSESRISFDMSHVSSGIYFVTDVSRSGEVDMFVLAVY